MAPFRTLLAGSVDETDTCWTRWATSQALTETLTPPDDFYLPVDRMELPTSVCIGRDAGADLVYRLPEDGRPCRRDATECTTCRRADMRVSYFLAVHFHRRDTRNGAEAALILGLNPINRRVCLSLSVGAAVESMTMAA